MPRSVRKGPYIDDKLLAKVDAMNDKAVQPMATLNADRGTTRSLKEKSPACTQSTPKTIPYHLVEDGSIGQHDLALRQV